MVCRAGARVLAIEGNPSSAVKAAEMLTRAFGQGAAQPWKVIQGMSSTTALASGTTFDAVLEEVLGNIASREGVIQIIADLQTRIAPAFWLPVAIATFFCPVNLEMKHLKANLESLGGTLLVGPNHIRISRLLLDSAAPWQAAGYPTAGCLEYYDFQRPLAAQMLQAHTKQWKAPKSMVINGLATWILAAFPFSPPKVSSRRAGATSAFPYGAEDVPATWAGALSFSRARCSADAEVEATNWDNLVMLFKVPVTLQAEDILEVQAWTDVRMLPMRYSWVCRILRGGESIPLETLAFDSRDILYSRVG
jgi:hypothetical protein